MIVNLAVVTSLDGKLTKHDSEDVSSWASKEDAQHLRKLISESDVIVMGGNTYRLAKDHIDLSQQVKRCVITRRPEQFNNDSVEGKLEFRNQSPESLIEELKNSEINNCLILGGPAIFAPLLEANLIDYLYLTIEPKIFGQGLAFSNIKLSHLSLKLENHKVLNQAGSLLLKYKLLK